MPKREKIVKNSGIIFDSGYKTAQFFFCLQKDSSIYINRAFNRYCGHCDSDGHAAASLEFRQRKGKKRSLHQ